MRNRALLAAGASAVLALVLAGTTFASGSTGGQAAGPWGRGAVSRPASHPAQPQGSEVIQFISQQTHFKVVDADDSGGFSVGDYFVFTENLFDPQSHKLIGTDHPRCMVDFTAFVCDGTFTLNGRGQIAVEGSLTNSSNVLAVTGGTGDFLTAGGEAFIRDLPSGRTEFTIFLTS
jgi:hypothetical protein